MGGSLLFAQSNILDVPAEDGEGNLIVNALITYIVADTNSSGEQLHDAYRLERGKTYLYNQSPVFKNPIILFADEPGTTAETKPPKIMVTTDDVGETPYAHCIETFADLTVKNIAFSTTSMDGAYSWANAILLNSDGLRIVLEGCHFTLTGWGIIEANVDNSVFVIDKCRIRNATVYDYGDEWCPFFFEINTGSADTLIARNNTWFNMQGSVVNIEQQNFVRYFMFDHNTLVNIVKGFTPLASHLESIITNNIFYNVEPHSVMLNQVEESEDGVALSVINADTLISNEPGSTLESPMSENERRLTVSNNCYFFTQGVQDYWAAHDSVVAVDWMNTVTQALFDDNTNYPYFISEDNVNIDPGFTNFGGTDGMVAMMNQHRAGEGFGFWGWDPDSVDYDPPLHWAVMQWPLPEDFSHSADIIGNDGFHIGSLEYYPSELAEYETTLSIDETDNTIPTAFSLRQNYPNPFNPVTTIDYQINVTNNVKMIVYNMLGQEIKTLVNDSKIAAGSYRVDWNGTDNLGKKVSNGIYLYRLQVGTESITKKMVFLK
jgi:hypothetical protein